MRIGQGGWVGILLHHAPYWGSVRAGLHDWHLRAASNKHGCCTVDRKMTRLLSCLRRRWIGTSWTSGQLERINASWRKAMLLLSWVRLYREPLGCSEVSNLTSSINSPKGVGSILSARRGRIFFHSEPFAPRDLDYHEYEYIDTYFTS
jgi:hypothetical protein